MSTPDATAASSHPAGLSPSGPRNGRRHRMGARDLGLVTAFAALVVVLGVPGVIPPFIGSVPITLQTLGVMLAGVLLGPRRAAAAMLVVLALCAIGLPVLAGGRGGLAVFAGPSAGYLLCWPIAAAIIGALSRRRGRCVNVLQLFAACLVGGILVVHLCGIPVMMWRAGLPLSTALLADTAFLPGDTLKAVVAAVVGAGVLRALPDLHEHGSPRR